MSLNDPLLCCAYFFIWLGRCKLGEQKEALAELQQRFVEHDYEFMNKWCQELAAYLDGRTGEAEFLQEAAGKQEFTTSTERNCEAYFFAGEKHLMDGDKKGASDFFAKCVRTLDLENFEYLLAKLELKALKAK